tara:strand:- start:83 stop:403 length:321 start_codon:yes stop_codon:yes gene_type:complete
MFQKLNVYTLISVLTKNKIEIKENNQGDTQLDLFIRNILNGCYETHHYYPLQYKNKMKKLLELLNYDFKIDQHKFLGRFSNTKICYEKPKPKKRSHTKGKVAALKV